ncbi:ABC transporter permease subunit [Catenovulum sp. SM1970]|uniref:ABC transporter permease subunit n=1 Tax=Marinifaba aquimaris TaxID=2741323 RepID=UPI001572A5B0|nr:ABC transporter permease subunit [Marinifaba aquimaris]NTS77812.1 ABC transporter permease subunit [Marinifaba aquimaris]
MAQSIYNETHFPTPLSQIWRNFRNNHIAWISLWIVMVFTVIAILAPILAPYSPYYQNPDQMLVPPSWNANGDADYLLGTDDLGRDFLSRLLHGTQLTFGSAIIVSLCAMLTGSTLGAMAGMSRGFKSSLFNHLLDSILSIPSLLLAIVIVAILGQGLENAVWAVFLALVPHFIHHTRNAIRQELRKEYIIAARLDGANDWQILTRSVLPNILDVVVIQFAFALSTAMLDIAALGFLGLGADPSTPEWGALLHEGIDLLYRASWLVTLPGVFMFMCLLSVNIIGHSLRRAIKFRTQ